MPYLFKLPPDLVSALVEIRAKTGLSLAEQVRRAVRAWVAAHQRQALPQEETPKGEGGESDGTFRKAPQDLP